MRNLYYWRFKLITYSPVFRLYLPWAYRKCAQDLRKHGIAIPFQKKDFTALLCGTSGEVTSEFFAKYILSLNKEAKIIILDKEAEQLYFSKKRLKKKFPRARIQFIQADARSIPLKNNSAHYIETDGFIEYFDRNQVSILFQEWHRILTPDGVVTTRAFARQSPAAVVLDAIRIWIAQKFFGVTIHGHTYAHLHRSALKSKLKMAYGGPTFLPTFKRLSFVKLDNRTSQTP